MTPTEILGSRGKIFRKEFLHLNAWTQLPPEFEKYLMQGDVLVFPESTAEENPEPCTPVRRATRGLPSTSYANFLAKVYDVMRTRGVCVITPPIEEELWTLDVLGVPETHPLRADSQTIYFDEVNYVTPLPHIRTPAYIWAQEILLQASRVLYRSHTTGSMFRFLKSNPVTCAFSLGEVARNENEDATHFIEFTQLEYNAFVPTGLCPLEALKESITWFLKEMDVEITDFKTTVNPFTHPSLECYVSVKGRNIQLVNGGVFTPSVLARCGLKGPRVGWGLGLERLYMTLYELTNIKEIADL